MSKQTVSNLAIVPDDRLVAVDVETLLGRVLDVAEGIVGVGGGSVPVCAFFSFSKIGKEKVYRHCQTEIFSSKNTLYRLWFDLFGVFVALAREEASRRGSRTSILNQ